MLVAKTLLCLADLVPILGSAVVIGGNRSKIFADGRPQGVPDQLNPWSGVRSITPVLGSGEFLSGSPTPGGSGIAIGENSVSFSSIVNGGEFNYMPERLSPEGEDIYHTNSDVEIEVDEWSDWENDSNEQTSTNTAKKDEEPEIVKHDRNTAISREEMTLLKVVSNQSDDLPNKNERRKSTKDKQSVPPRQESIENLDIKTQTFKKLEPTADYEMDFFKDMEPVIQKANVLLINDTEEADNNESAPLTSGHSPHRVRLESSAKEKESPLIASTRFDIKAEDLVDNEDGWDNEESEW